MKTEEKLNKLKTKIKEEFPECEYEYPVKYIEKLIIKEFGMQKRTVERYKKCLIEFGHFTEINEHIFRINKS